MCVRGLTLLTVFRARVAAMAKKPIGESRTPTDYWSGLGFSKSMPDHAIREQLRLNNVKKYAGPSMATTYEVSTGSQAGRSMATTYEINSVICYF